MTPDELDAIRALDAEATRGPWAWRGNTDSPGSLRLAAPGIDVLSTIPVERDPNDVHPDLLDACGGDEHAARKWQRHWAWDDAADCIRTDERLALVNPATFMYEPADTLAVYEVARAQGLPDDTPGDHPKVYRRDVVALRHPNARMLAEGRQAVTDLLAEVDRLRAERDEALRHVDTLRERCDALGKRDTGSDCIAVPPCAAVAERDEARVALDRVRALCSDHRATTTGYLHPADVLAAIDGGA